MFLCDMHCHSSGISRCAKINYKEAIDSAKKAGFKAIVLTNHYAKDYIIDNNYKEFIMRYVLEYEDAKIYGNKVGITVFFGVEVTMEFDRRVHLLIYGIDYLKLLERPNLFDLSLLELYSFCKKNKFALIQAHPFRGGTSVLDTRYLDGVEINCHPLYGNTYSDELIRIALTNHLAITCGCDYHGDVSYRPKGGMCLPDSIKTEEDLANYLINSDSYQLQIHEINSDVFDIIEIKTK